MPMTDGTCAQCDEKDARIVYVVKRLKKYRKAGLALLTALDKYGSQVGDLFGHDEELTRALDDLKKLTTEN